MPTIVRLEPGAYSQARARRYMNSQAQRWPPSYLQLATAFGWTWVMQNPDPSDSG